MNLLSTVFIMSLVCNAATASTQDPKARTESLIKTLAQIEKADSATGAYTQPAREHNRAVFKDVDTYFDLKGFSASAIAPHKAKFNTKQLQSFHETFMQLLRIVAYPKSGAFMKDAKPTIKNVEPQNKNVAVMVRGYSAADDFESHTTFVWSKQKMWRIADVQFDGASLLQDYRNQFGRIVEKEGADGLLKKLQDRLAKEKASKGMPL